MSVGVLPPTINALPPQQRIRLMKSTRKLGSLLGTTPHVEDVLQAEKLNRRSGGFFAAVPNASVSSFDSAASSESESSPHAAAFSFRLVDGPPSPLASKKPPTLVLSVRTDSLPSRRRASLASAITPISFSTLSSSSSSQRSPLSPTFLNGLGSQSKDVRRRRMEKLTRTLGENIPTELVFPPALEKPLPPVSFDPSRSQLRASRGRSWSVGTSSSTAELLRHEPTRAAVAPSSRPDVDAVSLAGSYTSSRPDSIAFSRTCTPQPPEPETAHTLVPVDLEFQRTHSSTSSIHSLQSLPTDIKRRGPSLGASMVRSASVRLRSNTIGRVKKQPVESDDGPIGAGKRKEKEWEGEWNTDDMSKVVNKLRNLKAK